MKKTLIVFLYILSNFILTGQSNFQPGFIIKNDLDTLHGLIDDFGEIRNTKTCHFKENENADVRIFKPEELWAFRFDNGKFYISKLIQVNGESHYVFLEYLLNGTYNLYYANIFGGEHYFLENEEGRISELSNEERTAFINESQYVRNTNKYIGVLKASFSDYPELFPEIEKTGLNHKSLIKITKEYHELSCKDKECIIYEKQNIPVKFRIGPSLGMYFMKFNYNSGKEELNFDLSIDSFFGFLLRMEFPRRNNHFAINITSDYAQLYFYQLKNSENSYQDYHVYFKQIKTTISPGYSIPISKIRINLSIGVQLNYYFDSEGKILDEKIFRKVVSTVETPFDIAINSFQFGATGGIGIDYPIKKKIVFLNTNFGYIPVSTDNNFTSRIIDFSLSAGILF